MCGICGFIGRGTTDDLERMTNALAHRGPDACGFWSRPDHAIALGHRRLSIVDLETGGQPMRSADGNLVVIFNGEIYNHRELRAELTGLGHQFVTNHSDTETLLHGYRAWGCNLPARLNGMWAFVIYDVARRELFASRDRFGKKPFYYSTLNGGFVFASELDAVRAHADVRARTSLSRPALKKYFGYGYIPAPYSIWTGVCKLPGGHSLRLTVDDPQRLRIERYWRFVLEPQAIDSEKAADARAEELRDAIMRAVSRRLLADVPVGVFLSGGVDSSAVTAAAARFLGTDRLNTFCIGFEEPSFDESGYARRVATYCQTRHHEERLSIEHARTLLPELADKLDEPFGDSSFLPTALLCRFASQHVKVALGGDGGDELFAGYDPFTALRVADLYRRAMPRPVHRALSLLAARAPVSHRNMSWDFRLKRFLRGMEQPPPLWLPTWMSPLTADELSDLFSEPIILEDVFSEAVDAWDRASTASLVDRATQFYIELYLQDDILTKIDRASMMFGLEARAPLLDIEVVDIARKIPSAWRFRRGNTKYLFKRAMRPLLPGFILQRRKKGFGVPIGSWFRERWLSVDHPIINPVLTNQLQEDHRAGRTDQRAFLWNMWLLTRWNKTRPT